MKRCNMKICPYSTGHLKNPCRKISALFGVKSCLLRKLFQRLHKAYLKDESAIGLNIQWAKEYEK